VGFEPRATFYVHGNTEYYIEEYPNTLRGYLLVEFVPFDLMLHKEIFIKLNIEFITWIADNFLESYQIDSSSNIGQTIPEYVETHFEELANLKPPNGIIYLLRENGKIIGMGGLRKLNEETGEIKRMYIRPRYRGRGYGKQLLNTLLEVGREFGCSSFVLETSKFMTAAQHIYQAAGFVKREEYPRTETPEIFRSYQIYMEKKEK
jgi:ribosomal protein S18 acetylase RimI-like enzyme